MFLVILNLVTAILSVAAAITYFVAGNILFGWIWIGIALIWFFVAKLNAENYL